MSGPAWSCCCSSTRRLWRSLDMECMLGLTAVPEPGCQETRRKVYGKVGWRLEPSYCPLEAFLREPKLNSQSTKALHKMLEEAQGKWMSAEHICGQWASLPADLAPKVPRDSRATHRSWDCWNETCSLGDKTSCSWLYAPSRQQRILVGRHASVVWPLLSTIPKRVSLDWGVHQSVYMCNIPLYYVWGIFKILKWFPRGRRKTES